jgi:glycosyltransferase involved in cell wall biosynthesis
VTEHSGPAPERPRSRAGGRRNDVAVYAPTAAQFYDESTPAPGEWGGGGAAFQASEVARGLAMHGMRVAHIVYPVKQPAKLGPGFELVEREIYLFRRAGLLTTLRDALATWTALRRADAAVYIVRGFEGYVLVAALFTALRRRRFIFSGSSDLDFDIQKRALGRLRTVLYRWAIRSADAVVVQTEQQQRLAARALTPGRRPTLISSFAKPARRPSGDRLAFVWIGRLVDYKRPLDFVRLAEEVPEGQFRMVCMETVGTDRELRAAIHSRADRLANLEILGSRPPDQLLQLIERSVAVVSTSDAEGMPNVFLEAWSRGTPVLTLRFDPDGIVRSRLLGVAAMGEWADFVNGARSLLADAGLRARIAENALRYVSEVHSPEAVASRWSELVRDVQAGEAH